METFELSQWTKLCDIDGGSSSIVEKGLYYNTLYALKRGNGSNSEELGSIRREIDILMYDRITNTCIITKQFSNLAGR